MKIIKETNSVQKDKNLSEKPTDFSTPEVKRNIFIDAGIEHFRIRTYDTTVEKNSEILSNNITIPNNDDILKLFDKYGVKALLEKNSHFSKHDDTAIYITGKLAEITKKVLRQGVSIMPAAVLWSAARSYFENEKNTQLETIGIIDLSASGYMVICVDQHGNLMHDLLIVNPRCGAGTGINLSRILEKLALKREDVDSILHNYSGVEGREKRMAIPVRADRCGVFSSSATVSDKNQGIPLDYALAVTIKSEVMKSCKKLTYAADLVVLTGGVFKWQYARNCAEDILTENGVKKIIFDTEQSTMMNGMKYLVEKIGNQNFRLPDQIHLRKPQTLIEFPAFTALKTQYSGKGLYERLPDPEILSLTPEQFIMLPVNVGLDIGSTMAKIVITNARTGELLFHNSYNNHGDTIETIKHIFRKLKANDIDRLRIQHIGITGSGRYQVQKALKVIFPHIEDRISVLVENYAHAQGSIRFAKEHIAKLKGKGEQNINENFYLLIDIGGEDTKISVVSLKKEELFDNAMNIKCSAGTGSLMDTLKALFSIDDIADAYRQALNAEKAYGINATCAVFLMENARKMQAEGYPKDEILASCCYAIVENMARSLWDQIEFPRNTITLLHGQTMLSDPLPLAVTHRIQEYTGVDTYCLVPPFPGHRACIGLIKSIEDNHQPEIEEYCYLDHLLERKFEKKIIMCHGAACGDKNARCARTLLNADDVNGKFSLTLGGCTAVNELQARQAKGEKIAIPDAYKEIWKYIDQKLAKSEDEKRLVIPRSFIVSEKAFFFSKIFEQFNIPVHVDNVIEQDIMEGQPYFTIDTCAPNIGATGQFLRLARTPHGMILIPQIDFLNTDGTSLGRTCTTNQGGILIASHFARMKYPQARFKLFDVSLKQNDPLQIADQLYPEFQSIFEYYRVNISRDKFAESIAVAQSEYARLLTEIAEITARFIEEAIDKKLNISIVNAREYILNPGIYDSHVGKLLRDKGVVAIPVHVFVTTLDEQFNHIYWKNPHDLMTKADAITNKRFHQIIKHPGLQKLIQKIEAGRTESLLSFVTVSTFRCGPDSVTLPLLAEITKNIPTLLIQSDAMIAELAHLENRVNTHLNQLNKSLHKELVENNKQNFSIRLLNTFDLDEINPATDILYCPTMGDNRAVISVFRSAGLTVIDNYDEETYDLEQKAKLGRKYTGDSVCVPLSAVLADMLDATDDFVRRKKSEDPLVAGKNRVVLLMHKGDGPCRQGQYLNICKLNFYKIFEKSQHNLSATENTTYPIKFLEHMASSLSNKKDYLTELKKWVTISAYQTVVMIGIMQSLYLKSAFVCKNHEELERFENDFRKLKQTINHRLEFEIKPGKFAQLAIDTIERFFPKLSGLAQYVGLGLYNNNGFRKIFKDFNAKWNNTNGTLNGKIKIHVEGEIYLRVAQLNEIFKSLIDTLGFDAFELTYTPIWSFFEYILESRVIIAEKEIKNCEAKLNDTAIKIEKRELRRRIINEKKVIKQNRGQINNLRNIFAKPLYLAAGVEMPHAMNEAIKAALPVIPKYKPFGELVPYVGETISHLKHGANLVLNVAPEGCMVASMGEILSPMIMEQIENPDTRIQYLFTTEGEINEELLSLALLKLSGPERFYKKNAS